MRPKLTFNDSIWNAYELKDIVSFSKGKNVSLDIVTETGFPAMMYGDIYIKYDTFFNKVDYCIPIELSKDSTIIDKNTILMTCTGETAIDIGKSVCYLGETPICIGGDILALKCTDNTDAKFLCLQLNTYDKIKERARLSQGHSVVHLYQHHIEKSKIYKPDIATQTKIATFLNLYYKKIELQKKKIEQLEKLSFDALFTHKYEGKTYKLEQVLTEVNERTTQNNQYEVISSTKAGLYYQKDYFNKEIASEDNTGYKILKLNQVVISPQNLWLGNINYNDKIEIGIVSPSYRIFNINQGFNKTFISHLLKSKRAMYDYMISSEQGASVVRRNLNIELFNEIIFMIPDIETQNHIAHQLVLINNKINLEKQKLEAMEKYKQGLLQQLFV